MTFVFAFLFAQSLLGDLSRAPARPAQPVAAPYAAANAEANAAVLADAAKAADDAKDDAEEPAAESAPAPEPSEEPVAEPAPATEPETVEEPAPAPAPEPETVEEPAPAPAPEPEPETVEEPAPAPAPEPEEAPVVVDVPKAPVPDKAAFEMPRSVKITSERTDYDRREGVIMFDQNVFVDDAEYKMHSDQLYVFLDGTNELKRIVAIGNVTITNETRVGSCAKAAYTKNVGKVVMYGDSSGVRARLADYGKRKSEVEGRKITFWIDSEQVEVEGSTVTLDAGGYGGKEGAKKLLGK